MPVRLESTCGGCKTPRFLISEGDKHSQLAGDSQQRSIVEGARRYVMQCTTLKRRLEVPDKLLRREAYQINAE